MYLLLGVCMDTTSPFNAADELCMEDIEKKIATYIGRNMRVYIDDVKSDIVHDVADVMKELTLNMDIFDCIYKSRYEGINIGFKRDESIKGK